MSEGHSSISICAKCLWSVWVCSNYVQYVPSITLVEAVQLSEQLLVVLNVDIYKTISLVHRPMHAQVSRLQCKLMQITTDNASPLHLVSVAITDILWYMASDVAVWQSHDYCQANIELGGMYSKQIEYSSKHLLCFDSK